jgi:hypothetical protein
VDAAGNAGPTGSAVFELVGGDPSSPPVIGTSVNVDPLSGEVFVSLPGAGGARIAAEVPGLKGREFIPLSEARQIPVGSLLDTRKGSVRLTSATGRAAATQAGSFAGGVFQILQSRRRSARGLTELALKGASFGRCRRGRSASAAQLSRRTIRRLRSNANGRFRTRGRHSAATVRGTTWTVTDRCDGPSPPSGAAPSPYATSRGARPSSCAPARAISRKLPAELVNARADEPPPRGRCHYARAVVFTDGGGRHL